MKKFKRKKYPKSPEVQLIYDTILHQFTDKSIRYSFPEDNSPLNLGRRLVINGEKLDRSMVSSDADWNAIKISAFATIATYNAKLLHHGISEARRAEWMNRQDWVRSTFGVW